jgi:predicted CXXCH cytochrome family protein
MILLLVLAADYAGPQACAECHPMQYASQHNSRHANALRKATFENTKLRSMSERGGASFRYEPAATGVRLFTQKADATYTAVLEWTFGAGSQATTSVGRIADGRYFEHRLSFYTKPQRLALSPGHSAAPSFDAESAIGIVQAPESIDRCFHCHAANVKPGGPDFAAMIPGVTCERCHGAGAKHIEAARAKQPKLEIFNAGKLGKAGVAVCAECHRSPNVEYRSEIPEVEDPLSVRFAPVGFQASRCFQKSATFSCVTCHNPHEDPRPEANYTQICLGCHAAPKHQRAVGGNCVACHMPKSSPIANLTFTDHRIR